MSNSKHEEPGVAERDALITLRRAAEITGTPLGTVRRWAYTERVLPIERIGPTRRVRVRLSVIYQFFGRENCRSL